LYLLPHFALLPQCRWADPTLPSIDTHNCPLFEICSQEKPDAELVDAMLKAGAEPEGCGRSDGLFPLFAASRVVPVFGSPAIVYKHPFF